MFCPELWCDDRAFRTGRPPSGPAAPAAGRTYINQDGRQHMTYPPRTPRPAGPIATRAVSRSEVTLACQARQVGAARRFVAAAIGPHRDSGTAVLLVSELATNSCTHSTAAQMTIAVTDLGSGIIRIEVTDGTGTSVPAPRQAGLASETGRGLHLVSELAVQWGYRHQPGGNLATWCDVMAATLSGTADPDT